MRPCLLVIALLVAACGSPDPELEAADCTAAALVPFPGESGPVVAMNSYFLQEEAARALRFGLPQSVVEEVLTKAASLGVRALRTNGFNDDPAKIGDSTIQVAKLQYDEVSLRGLDEVLARAHAHGVRLVLTLGNYWDAYGGARQYVAWAGLPDPVEGDPRFFTDRGVRDHYLAHVGSLLDRISAVDGLRYGDHPAVLAWELLNEPRGAGLDTEGNQLRAWIDEVAAKVKEKAPHQLVGTGEEGFDSDRSRYDLSYWREVTRADLFAGGSSFAKNLASPFIDFGSVHLYPEEWGFGADLAANGGARWIDEHARIAHGLGKPLFVGEFGLRNDGAFDSTERRAMYRGWFSCARTAGVAGISPWMFANDSRPDAWDSHTFYWKDGTDPADPVNRYADIVRDAARH